MELYNLGRVPWEESQLIYHALAYLGREAMCKCFPATPYFCIGYHQDISQEVDLEYSADNNKRCWNHSLHKSRSAEILRLKAISDNVLKLCKSSLTVETGVRNPFGLPASRAASSIATAYLPRHFSPAF